MRAIPASFYKSSAWLHTRAAYLEQCNYICERCMEQGVITPAEDVHHIVHLTPANYKNPEVSLNPENLMALCQRCHNEVHNRYNKARWRADANGKVTAK